MNTNCRQRNFSPIPLSNVKRNDENEKGNDMLKTKLMLAAVALAASASWAQAEEVNLWVRTSSAAVLQALAEKAMRKTLAGSGGGDAGGTAGRENADPARDALRN